MFDIVESDHKKFKNETVLKTEDLEKKIDELIMGNQKLTEMKEELDKKFDELQVCLDYPDFLQC